MLMYSNLVHLSFLLVSCTQNLIWVLLKKISFHKTSLCTKLPLKTLKKNLSGSPPPRFLGVCISKYHVPVKGHKINH